MPIGQAEVRDGASGPAWHREVLRDLADRLMPPSDFPCTFSQNAFRRGLIDFIFVEDAGEAALMAASQDLSTYVAAARGWDGQVNSARPLVMAFSKAATPFDGLAEYHAFGWQVLRRLHVLDPAPWPDSVARDPEAPFWSFCHSGMQLFVNMSAPAHVGRASRNLGGHFLFVINPRERFDQVAGDTPEGRRVRGVIRARAEAYDGQPHAPVLGLYQKGELEWPQYALPDTNDAAPGRCPFAGP
jgi:FPC/CPF motif-containing protein YcgG